MVRATSATADVALPSDHPQWALGQNIVRYRRAVGLSQRQVAEALGVARGTVSRWETGHCMPERKHLLALGLLLKATPDQLFERPNPRCS